MNDRQQDELLALQAIYPDAVSWELLSGNEVQVAVVLPVEFEEDRELEVWDHQASVASGSSTPIQDLVGQLHKATLVVEPGMVAPGQGAGKGRRGRGGKGGRDPAGPAEPPPRRGGAASAQLEPTATTFQPRRAATKVPVERDAPARSPPPPPPKAPSSLPPISSTGTPRIRFTPRAPDASAAPAATSATPPRPVATPANPRRLAVRYLPSLHLSIRLPVGYPESEGPSCISLREEVGWLGEERKGRVEERLRDVYAGDECLFGIMDLVSSASPEFTDNLALSFPLVLRQPPASSASTSPLSSTLSAFNLAASDTTFATTSHPCPLCFSSHRGSSCIRLASCGCVFCTPCLKDYFDLLITEGLVRSVACPSEGCVAARARWEKEVGPRGEAEKDMERPGRLVGDEVERLCGVEKRKRWEWLKEKMAVESDPSITFCPRESCQAPVPKLSEDEEKLRVCPACSFSFCQFCKSSWHGTRNACALPQSSTIVSSYLDGDEAARRSLEARYGVANIKRLVAAFEEERALREWLDANATECPGCGAWVNKSGGCSHMTCTKCQAHFCYRCGLSLRPTDPYKHYNTPGSRCYGKLFEFMPGQEPPIEEWIGALVQEDELAGF
ncbi:hypothetical protein JCM8208_004261 [Rhodotorula glutinis]